MTRMGSLEGEGGGEGGGNLSATSGFGGLACHPPAYQPANLLLSASADVRAADDVIAFKGTRPGTSLDCS